MQLPLKLNADLMQTRWKSILDPILENPLNDIFILDKVVLKPGKNQVQHKLQRKQQGWVVLDIKSAATIYNNSEFTDSTLELMCIPNNLFITGNTTAGSTTITNIPSTLIMFVQLKQSIFDQFGSALAADTLVTGIGENSITISKAALTTTTSNPFQLTQTEVVVKLGVF